MSSVNLSPSLRTGRWLIVVSAVLWSTSGFFAKAPIFTDWPADSRGLSLACWRAAFAALALVFFVRHVQWSWRLIPMVTVFAVMNWAYLQALVLCEPTLAIWLQYSAPAWVFLLSWLFFGELPVRRDWVLLVLAGCGVGLILWAEWSGKSPAGVRYGILSGLSFALVMLTLKWNRDFESTWLVFLNNATTAVVLAPILFIHDIWPVGQQWFYLAAFGVMQFAIPYFLFATALRSVSSHEASGLVLLEPILVPVWVFIAWRNDPEYQFPAATTLMGAGLILAGLAIRYFWRPGTKFRD